MQVKEGAETAWRVRTTRVCVRISGVDTVDQGTFVRAWAVSPTRFSWFLGAGTSAAAGLPTATQIHDDLLLDLYAERHQLLRENLHPNDPSIQNSLELYFDGSSQMRV